MTESEFALWALSMGIDDREMIARFVTSFEETHELNYEEPVGTTAVENGFIIIACCPDGDPIAVDMRINPGSVHYISAGDSDEEVVSKMVAPDIRSFVGIMDDETIPYDYHEAIAWQSAD